MNCAELCSANVVAVRNEFFLSSCCGWVPSLFVFTERILIGGAVFPFPCLG